MMTICDTDFTAVLSQDGFNPCLYEDLSDTGICPGVAFTVQLSLDTMTAIWTLDFSLDTHATTTRTCADGAFGAYGDTSDGGFSFWLTFLVVS
jgi:hypothetical protein